MCELDPAPVADLVDLHTYPLHLPGTPEYDALVARCRAELAATGMYDLVGFVRPAAIERSVRHVRPLIDGHSFEHRRAHNIYFLPPAQVAGVAAGHPALASVETVNRTVCADQLEGSPVLALYEWEGLGCFVAATVGAERLHLMDDPLGRVNVMSYRHGEALNWHFDRSEFTITLLLQRPQAGGDFEFRPRLRTDADPNYDGVAALLAGGDTAVQRYAAEPGTLHVFFGRHTAHRVTPVRGDTDRLVGVFSYYDRPGVSFSVEERIGFYGRA